MIRVVLVDDQTLVRQGLRRLLEFAPDIEVVGEAGDGEAAVRLIAEVRPDAVLLDVRLPGLNGVAVLEALRARGALPPTLMLTTFNDDEVMLRSLKAGARGFVLKDVSLEQLLADLRQVIAGGRVVRVLSHDHPSRGVADDTPSDLTEREREVLRLMPGGYSNREIAEMLGIREGTVKNHVSTILLKLGARDRTRAVLLALEQRLI